jgi:hypothetical protein
MLNSDKTKLKIFENFNTDYNLPKHKKDNSDDSVSRGGSFISNPEDWSVSAVGSTYYDGKQNWFKRLGRWISGKTTEIKVKREEKKKLNPSEFFKEISSTLEFKTFDSKKYVKRVDGYLSAIENAKKLGQIALVEKLQKEIDLVKCESLLFGIGNVKTITEEQVIHFYKKSKKGLRLDWIKNFTRIIPNKIVKQKIKIDNLKVFDNYVILHFDPNEDSYELTQKEKEDPIIFGVIHGSRKLYYIADWKDKYCDLTLDTLIDEFGKKAINANDISVKFE